VRSFSALWGLEYAIFAGRELTVHVYRASCEQIFRILAAWKSYFCRFVKPTCIVTSLRVWKFSSFLRPENAILPTREIHVSKVTNFVWANFPHFGELKMTFLPKVSCLECRKFDFSRVVKPTFHERVSIFSVFWRTINEISVYWLELDGLLTETGRSVDGNWMLSACICTHEAWCCLNVHFTLGKSAFLGMKNEENFLTLCEVP